MKKISLNLVGGRLTQSHMRTINSGGDSIEFDGGGEGVVDFVPVVIEKSTLTLSVTPINSKFGVVVMQHGYAQAEIVLLEY